MHRRDDFRAAPDSVNKMRELVAEGKMDFKVGQASALQGADGQLAAAHQGEDAGERVDCDVMLPFFGLTMKLGPVAELGPQAGRELIPVDTARSKRTSPACSPSATSTPIRASSSSSCRASTRPR